jgi:GNAT superfamily N-acetyltransferase
MRRNRRVLAFPGLCTDPLAVSAQPLSFGDLAEIVAVMSDAFYDYPVMAYVLGSREPYERRLHTLVELFVSNRAYRNDPMVGVRDETGALVGAATMTLPRPTDPPPELVVLREKLWGELGADAQARYDEFVAATQRFAIGEPHYHLNMIGIRRSHHGRGLARPLLDAVHDRSRTDDGSSGVSLTTERSANVRLYEHFGYRVVGQARVGDAFETWTLFRADRSQ